MVRTPLGTILEGQDKVLYKIIEFLGAGSFGEVYRASSEDNSHVVAVKVLPVNDIDDPELRHALLNESKLATNISHPNVVKVLFAGEDAEVGPYMMMEYISGQTLYDFLRVKSEIGEDIPLSAATEIMMHIAQGARAINEVLVHRDIKPDNIIRTGNLLKIADFGLSKMIAERTRTNTFKGIGPIKYMSPEGWQGHQNTFKMDVYSVGIVFYEILTFKHPFANLVEDPTHFESWRNVHLYQLPVDIRTIRTDVPQALSQLISRMMAKGANERPGWNESLEVISTIGSTTDETTTISEIVQLAIQKKSSEDNKQLQEQKRENAKLDKLRLYQASYKSLVAKWQPIVDQFNSEYQHGNITVSQRAGLDLEYSLPNAPNIDSLVKTPCLG